MCAIAGIGVVLTIYNLIWHRLSVPIMMLVFALLWVGLLGAVFTFVHDRNGRRESLLDYEQRQFGHLMTTLDRGKGAREFVGEAVSLMKPEHVARSAGDSEGGEEKELPPPGWYPDPIDPSKQRWWNGSSWASSKGDDNTWPLT
jgi:hypothetical protein